MSPLGTLIVVALGTYLGWVTYAVWCFRRVNRLSRNDEPATKAARVCFSVVDRRQEEIPGRLRRRTRPADSPKADTNNGLQQER
jgi:hypothetical protein